MGTSKTTKVLFEVGEEVLCYEPDPNKAQVLYDSKVLEVVETKEKGKRSYEYRVHFKGWKASWDRFVGEKFILKVDEKNLALQKELAKKADALNVKKKKPQPSLADLIRASIEGGGNVDANLDDSPSGSSVGEPSGDADDDDSRECVPLVVPEVIKQRLEDDFIFINEDNMLVKLPATLTVARILEDCVIHFCLSELAPWIEKMRNLPLSTKPSISGPSNACNQPSTSKGKGVPMSTTKSNLEEKADAELALIVQRTQLIREIAESTRTMFDFMLTHILLYAQEESQYTSVKNLRPEEAPSQLQVSDYITNVDFMSKKTIHQEQNQTTDDSVADMRGSGIGRGRKRGCAGPSSSRATTIPSLPRKLTDCALYPYADKLRKFIKKVMNRKLQPDVLEHHGETNPSFLYGSTHLLRLFVKLPEILSKMNMPRKRLAVVVQLLNRFIQYISTREETIDINTLYFAVEHAVVEEMSSDDESDSDESPKTKRRSRNDSK